MTILSGRYLNPPGLEPRKDKATAIFKTVSKSQARSRGWADAASAPRDGIAVARDGERDSDIGGRRIGHGIQDSGSEPLCARRRGSSIPGAAPI